MKKVRICWVPETGEVMVCKSTASHFKNFTRGTEGARIYSEKKMPAYILRAKEGM